MKIIKLLFVLLVTLSSCRSCNPSHTTRQPCKELKPKCEQDKCRLGYAYQDNNDWFFYYWFVLNTHNANSDYYSQYTSSALPPGGSWTKTEVAPQENEVVAEKEVAIQETADGEPDQASPSEQSQEESAAGAWENEGGAVAPEPASPSESSESSSDSGSGGGDSGGGGDGGGGGGD